MDYKTVQSVWDDPNRRYPTIAYIETTNHCNFHCQACPVDRHKNPKGYMSLEDFKIIADKVKARGIKIGAMFCFGEPLLDPTYIEKLKYGKSIGVFTEGHIGINTNVSMLTPEKYDGIMQSVANVTLSFFNIGDEFNRLTGTQFWDKCYKNAIDFIEYRDAHYPKFDVFIGTNKVDGFSQSDVQKAFSGYRVKWAHDANIKYGKHGMLTGVIDRTIMYNWWTCDGHKGAIQVKWNGDCGYCAYDIINWDTNFANILTDSWDEIESKFKTKWKSCSKLCEKCDYWYRYNAIIKNGCKRPSPLTDNWYDWQIPFLPKGERFIE